MTRAELLSVSKPILFNTEAVRAILDGRKTETRRVVKPHYKDDEIGFNIVTNAHDGSFVRIEKFDEWESTFDENGGERIVNPPYNAGDILYVRETWAHCNIASSDKYLFKADYDTGIKPYRNWRWRPSIHMPKGGARLFLKVTDVKAEQLQDITEEGAKAEGIRECCIGMGESGFAVSQNSNSFCDCAKGAFADLWNSTIPKKNRDLYGWSANPWVWVIEFERINITE